VQSGAKTVDDCLLDVAPERQEALREVRSLIREELPELREEMRYGMATYTRIGEEAPEIAFASQAKYISIYFPVPVITTKSGILAGLNIGKCCVRYSSVSKLNFTVITELLKETAKQYRP
jgi:uncharacterized protein YdhG (YjbR/CyaY superfamily)